MEAYARMACQKDGEEVIMSGAELKKVLKGMDVNFVELSKQLGFANDQRLHSALRASDVKTGLVERIAQALGCRVSDLYGEGANSSVCRDMERRILELEEQNRKYWSVIENLTRK